MSKASLQCNKILLQRDVENNEMMDKLLTVKEAAPYLGVSKSTVYRLCLRGLPHIKKSFGIRIKHHDLEKWLEQDKRKTVLVDNILRNVLTNSPSLVIDNAGGEEVASKSKARRNYGYGSVYKRKKGKSWTIDFYDERGRRIQKTIPHATTIEEAVLALQQEVAKTFDRAHGIEHRREEIGFRDFAQIYLEDYMKTTRRNFKPDTYRLQILCTYFKNVDLRTITPLEIERFRASRLRRGNSKSTANRYLQLMGKMFSLAVEEGYLEENPARKVKPFSEKDNLKERILTEKEERKLMENSSSHLKPIIITALHTGMRKAEILNLTWNQIDFSARIIKVVRTKSEKTRHIPINDDLFKQILNLKRENGQSPFVFLNPKTKLPFLDMKTPFKRACKISGIEGLRFHDLRHTFASRLVANGIDIETVRDLLGHHSILVTQRYVHSSDERKRKAVEILSNQAKEKSKSCDNLVTIENQSGLIN